MRPGRSTSSSGRPCSKSSDAKRSARHYLPRTASGSVRVKCATSSRTDWSTCHRCSALSSRRREITTRNRRTILAHLLQGRATMCYSAQIVADYRKYVRMFGAHMSIREFAQLYWERAEGSNIKIPKAMDAAFSTPQTDEERRIREAIDRFNGEQATRLEQELFKQRARLADAERTLQSKATKAASESKRIAT